MNPNKFLFTIFFALTVLLIYQSYKVLAISESNHHELMLNELSLYRMVNLHDRQMYADIYEGIFEHPSSRPSLIRCGLAAQCNRELFQYSSRQMKKAFLLKNDDNLANNMIVNVLAIHRTMLQELENFTTNEFSFNEIHLDEISNDIFVDIRLSQVENILNQNYLVAMDFFGRNCSPNFCGFDTFEGMLNKHIGKKSIHDSLDLQIPTKMKLGLKERIQITFSKKFVNKLIDSLRLDSRINSAGNSSYSTSSKLIANGFWLRSLDNERQAVSESNYTTWEYDLIPEITGVKVLELQVGVILKDLADNEIVEYVTVPLTSITVIE